MGPEIAYILSQRQAYASMSAEGREIPSITKQTDWEVAFFDFGKARVPGTDYYNPAIVEREDGLWLITRRSVDRPPLPYGFNDLMAFKLGDDLKPIFGQPVQVPRMSEQEHVEDPRAIMHGGKMWLGACNFVIFEGGKTWTGAHQIFCEVDHNWNAYRRHDPIFGKNGAHVRGNRGDEKNWLWFFYAGNAHMVYMTQPHTVVRFDGFMRAVETYETKEINPLWRYGQPRGGTPPVLIGDEYWSFFHSSQPWRGKKRQYYMGAYAFEAKPPFRITRMSRKPLLAGSQRDPWWEGKPLVVFPCGKVLKDGNWIVSMGINDICSAWLKIPHSDVEKQVDPVKRLPDTYEVKPPADEALMI